MNIEDGQEYRVNYPFCLEVYTGPDMFGEIVFEESWRPGVRMEAISPEDFEPVADGEGQMIITVVDVHKPGRYPERVFFTRKWKDPEGKIFGASKLHITTTPTFKRRIAGYYHEYRIL